jgi:hypothetical protein
MKAISFSAVLLLFFVVGIEAQDRGLVQKTGDCSGFHENSCKKLPGNFERNGQSKSALFAVGDTSELRLVAYKGHDYRIDICKDEETFSNEIRFRILDHEMKRETRVELDTSGFNNERDTVTSYEKKEVVLYDNKKDDNAKSLEFSNPDKTRRMTIQVIATGESSMSGNLKKRDMGCIGVSIGHQPSRKTGF